MGMAEFQDDDFTRIIELTPALRRRIERTIESLVALLDSYDGDPDEEPSLGWTVAGQIGAVVIGGDECEPDLEAYDTSVENHAQFFPAA